ncbi:MAG: hypothetical protein IJK38_03030 [Oscillospiraceae bacterium]|nr:hypothetical protein [Clostridia bacterium]MBR0391276.1 hypothetical protein [Oscillospiraceae bacterium]
MQQEMLEAPASRWLKAMGQGSEPFHSDDELQMQEHPWLARMAEKEEEDSLGEMLRYALDELRFA